MAFTKIEESDVLGKKVSDLPDTPEMSAAELKARFDKVSEEVVIPKFNALVNDLSAEEAADKIGAIVPEGIESEKNIGAVIRAITKITLESWNGKHSHENKSVLNAITDTVKKSYDRLVTLFEKINIISDTVSDDNTLLPTGKAIVAYVKKLGAGDMQAAVYDSNNNGVVDDAEKLGGELPSKYQKVTDKTLETESKTIPGAINELYVLAQNGGKALVGNDFSELTDYSIGDYAIKDNTLYRFIAEKLAGAWDDSVVVATTVEAELQEIIVNFTTAANGIGDAIAAKGVDVPVGTSLLEMAAIITNTLYKPPQNESGMFTVASVGSKKTITRNVTFTQVFENVPQMTVGAKSAYVVASLQSVTKAGAIISLYNNGGATVSDIEVSWTAVD